MLKCLPWGTESLDLDYEVLDDVVLRLNSITAKEKLDEQGVNMSSIYTVYRGRIKKHEVLRETKTGWTVVANWKEIVTTHIKRSPFKEEYSFCFDAKYTTENLTEAVGICETFQEALKCKIRDSESDVMNLHKFL